jgi:mannose-6-phosphate isomerase-like protein (cupin superfamily)
MTRRLFLQWPVAAHAISSLMKADARDTVFVKADTDRDDKPFRFIDGIFHVKVSGRDTEGRCVIFDTLRPDKVGPALHLHTDCDEWFFVREGEFKFQVGDQIRRLKPGDSLLAPQGVQHAFVKISEGVGRLIVMHQPAATIEEFFRTGAAQPDLTAAERRVLGERHGMKFVGEPLRPD